MVGGTGRADLRGAVGTLQTMAPGSWDARSGCDMADGTEFADRRTATGPWDLTARGH